MRELVITRGSVAQLGSLIGGSGLLFALLGLIWQGGTLTPLVAGLLVVGLLGIGLWAWMTPQEFIAFMSGRQARRSTVSIFSTLLMIGVVSLLYIIVQREVIVADMTIDNRFTLSPETQELLQAVARSPQPLEITAFYYPREVAQREIDAQYIQLYVNASAGKIRSRYINPLEQPAFSERYQAAIEQGINVFISFLDENGDIIPSSTIPVNDTGAQEADITEALARLLATGRFKIYFERGMDTLDPIANAAQGISILNNLARTNGIITDSLSLQQLANNNAVVPSDASALVIARPRRQMTPDELRVLDNYVQRGGSLFIAGDVLYSDQLFMAEGTLFNRYLWETFGLRLLNAVVVDPQSSGRNDLEVVSAAVFGNNQITAGINLEGRPQSTTLFDLARVVEVDDDPPVNNGRAIMTTPNAWGETNWDALSTRNEYRNDADADLPGPLVTVAWANNEETGSKVVLVGDGDFLMNGQVQNTEGNAQLFLNSIGWMTGFTEATRFQPQAFSTTPVLFVSGETLDAIAFITVILMPGFMLVAAFGIWMRRLRQ